MAKASGWGSPNVAGDPSTREKWRLKLAQGVADTAAEQDMSENPDSPTNRRLILSNGRALEILRFHLEQTASRGLHLCPECDSGLVQPREWGAAPAGFWELELCCPNCHWEHEGLFSQAQVDAFEEQLDDGLVQMLGDLSRLAQANMAEDIDRFARALRCDLILPEDF
jgi:hypothetical protein